MHTLLLFLFCSKQKYTHQALKRVEKREGEINKLSNGKTSISARPKMIPPPPLSGQHSWGASRETKGTRGSAAWFAVQVPPVLPLLQRKEVIRQFYRTGWVKWKTKQKYTSDHLESYLFRFQPLQDQSIFHNIFLLRKNIWRHEYYPKQLKILKKFSRENRKRRQLLYKMFTNRKILFLKCKRAWKLHSVSFNRKNRLFSLWHLYSFSIVV